MAAMSVSMDAANTRDHAGATQFGICMIEAKPEHLIGDKACDGDK